MDNTSDNKWTTWATIGAFLMMIAGGFKLISGVIGLFRDEWVIQGYQGYLLVDITGLAVWTLAVGVLLLLGGAAALSGKRWGEVVGIIAVSLAALSEFFMIPYFPIWSILLLVIYVLVLIGFVKAPASRD
jgi:hypothetical protein